MVTKGGTYLKNNRVVGSTPSDPGCFKNQDPEKYCLIRDDPAFCKTIGDICDADGFVKPEDAYCADT